MQFDQRAQRADDPSMVVKCVPIITLEILLIVDLWHLIPFVMGNSLLPEKNFVYIW